MLVRLRELRGPVSLVAAGVAVGIVVAACAGPDGSGGDAWSATATTAKTETTAATETTATASEAGTASTGVGTQPTTVGTAATTSVATSIAATGSTTVVESSPPGLEPLIAGHNRLDGDRINLIFAPWGWDDLDQFRVVTNLFLGWDQRAQLVDDSGYPAEDPSLATSAQLGLFGFEPFRSNRSKFNLWLTEVEPPGPALWLNTDDVPFGLADQSIVTMALDPDREVPGIYSVAGQDNAFVLSPEPARSGPDSVANAMIYIPSYYPASSMLHLPHELGHALFGLADEYVGRAQIEEPGLPPRVDIWPSCAASQETAERWWGDLVGDYDPMIDLWAQEMTAAGFGHFVGDLDVLRDLVRTDFIDDGCHGDPGSVRSAEDTMMGYNTPAFGLTNRLAAERILSLWAG